MVSLTFSLKCDIVLQIMEVKNWSQFMDAVLLRKKAFLLAFFVVFTISYAILAALDFLPELVMPEDKVDVSSEVVVETPAPTPSVAAPLVVEEVVVEPVYPTSITIPALKKTVTVLNPASRSIADLDTALLEGVVRHPDSATLEQKGTVFILGHSSYLPAVRNKNFQAFNGIQDLAFGDEIYLETEGETYIYRVEKVYRARADEVTVPIAGDVQRLVIATCNSFGTVDDRYIVEADLVEVKNS
jgi:LPXTG-site transpeptidase (sortase) family protein